MSAIIMDPKKARALCEKVAKLAKRHGATEAEVELGVSREGYLRFAANEPTQSGEAERHELVVHAAIGRRHAEMEGQDFSERGLDRLAEEAVARAKASPEDEERLPDAGAQRYPNIPQAFDTATASGDPKARATAVKAMLDAAKGANLVAAGFYIQESHETTRVTLSGQYGIHRSTRAELSGTMRKPDGSGSGWVAAASVKASDLDPQRLAKTAVERARAWIDPVTLQPGPYTVVLEPAALSTLLGFIQWSLDARAAEEGRSCFAKPGGGSKVGEKLFAPSVTLVSDPADTVAPGRPWGEGGLAATRQPYIENGTLKGLRRTRYWAKKAGGAPTPDGGNLRLQGGSQGNDALISGCEKGLLVTRCWYVRSLDPQTLTVTGLTRDATFLIENGKVTRAVKNFRFNQSITAMLANVEALGREELSPDGNMAVPGARVKGFNMSSISEAV
jgi:predicted Zn-dependent protease